MKPLRYSEIVGPDFYNIGLTEGERDMVDVHFTAAAHHFHRMKQSKRNPDAHSFHCERHRAHLRAMMSIIYKGGDFRNATDDSLSGLDKRSAWFPMGAKLPSAVMFDLLEPDPHAGIAVDHSSDVYLRPDQFETIGCA